MKAVGKSATGLRSELKGNSGLDISQLGGAIGGKHFLPGTFFDPRDLINCAILHFLLIHLMGEPYKIGTTVLTKLHVMSRVVT